MSNLSLDFCAIAAKLRAVQSPKMSPLGAENPQEKTMNIDGCPSAIAPSTLPNE